MMTEDILRMILMVSGTVLVLVVIYAVVELIRTLRWVRYTAEDLQPSIKQATEVLEALEPTVRKANDILEDLRPTIQRVDPLVERISLTVDAVNLEIMRADQILANLTDVTDVASNAAKKVNVITDAPLNLLTSATDKVRTIFSEKKPEADTKEALDQAGANQQRPPLAGSTIPTDAPAPATPAVVATPTVPGPATPEVQIPNTIAADAAVTAVTQAVAAAAAETANQTTSVSSEEMVPPYQDDIEIVEPESKRPLWPF